MVGTGSECVMCMEVNKKEETVEGAQALAVPAIPAGGARKARTVAGVKIKVVSSEIILQWISKTSLEI